MHSQTNLFCVSEGREVNIYDLRTPESSGLLAENERFRVTRVYEYDENVVLTGDEGGFVKFYDIRYPTLTPMHSFNVGTGPIGPIFANRKVLICATENCLSYISIKGLE